MGRLPGGALRSACSTAARSAASSAASRARAVEVNATLNNAAAAAQKRRPFLAVPFMCGLLVRWVVWPDGQTSGMVRPPYHYCKWWSYQFKLELWRETM